MQIYKPFVIDFETTQELFQKAQDLFIERVLGTVGDMGSSRILLSGGQTPLPFYEKLSHNAVIDWSKIEIYQSDERYLSDESQDSNQKQISKSFENSLSEIKELNFFNTKLPIDIATRDYGEKLETLDGPYFDFAILGIGEDGHIASLFPEGDYLQHQDVTVIETEAPLGIAGKQRMSLTIESILNTTEILVILTGARKEYILGELLEGKKTASEFPAKFLLAHPNVNIFQCLQGD